MSETQGRTERRFVFDAIADLYAAARPSYPEALFGDVIGEAALSTGDRVLEVGCGPGNATQGFAGKGFRITALDPGPELIRVAHERVASADVTYVVSTFEDWPVQAQAFRLVFAAQAWHWIRPEIAFTKASAALVPSGVLAVFSNDTMDVAEPLLSALLEVYRRLAPGVLHKPGSAGDANPLPHFFQRFGDFGPVVHKSYAWSASYSANGFADLQRTVSSHRLLADDERERLLDEVVAVVNAHGGQLDLPFETHLYMAHRKA
jgi:SAM-dependent methyltransferase